MRLEKHMRISMDEAEGRALKYLKFDQPTTPAMVAGAIWPGHHMVAQGAGFAASKVLRRLQDQGFAGYRATRYSWGWVKI